MYATRTPTRRSRSFLSRPRTCGSGWLDSPSRCWQRTRVAPHAVTVQGPPPDTGRVRVGTCGSGWLDKLNLSPRAGSVRGSRGLMAPPDHTGRVGTWPDLTSRCEPECAAWACRGAAAGPPQLEARPGSRARGQRRPLAALAAPPVWASRIRRRRRQPGRRLGGRLSPRRNVTAELASEL